MDTAARTIISCAITGSVHTPSMSPWLPVTPAEIARQATEAAGAGAAILHLHARDPDTGYPSPDPAVFRDFLTEISEATDAVINITTGGSSAMTVEDRIAAARALQPEVASLNMGSMNFNFVAAAGRVTAWKYEWEEAYVRGSDDRIFANTFRQIERTMIELGANGTRFEFECYDVGHLYNLAHFVDRGLVDPPLLIQCVLGVLGGIGADPDNLLHMISVADRLFGDGYRLSAFGAGRHQMTMAMTSALNGGHVRVGLEDNLYLGPGELARSNADQVRKARRLLEELGRVVATPDDARAMLALKGRHEVKF